MKSDEVFMKRAIALAARGGDDVFPNPRVGCVIVKDGRVVGEGFHRRFGEPHAEQVALAIARRKAQGAIAYVTLEPCCHTNKKSPPCAPSLIRAGIKRVVIGMKDPHPEVAGRGIRELAQAGIAVSSGILRNRCAELNPTYISNTRKMRPYVILKAAASLDGRIETACGESKWITSEAARRASRRMRREVDAILVGVETVIKDNPALTTHGGGRNPVRIILDSSIRTPKSARVLDGEAPTLLMTAKKNRTGARRYGKAHCIYTPKNGAGLDLRKLLRRLSTMGIGKVLVEGGSKVHTAFLENGLVDEVRLFIAPRLIGGKTARSFFEGHGISRLRFAKPLSGVTVRQVGPDLLVTGKI